MKWTEPNPYYGRIPYYNETTCETELGKMVIFWNPLLGGDKHRVKLNGEILGTLPTLEKAKELADNYLKIAYNYGQD